MKLRRSIIRLVALALGFALGTSGCASLRQPAARPNTAPTYALAVTVVGGGEPTAEQWTNLRNRFGQVLAARGLVLVGDLGQADQVIMVLLTPASGDSTADSATVTAIVPNVLGYASTIQPAPGRSSTSYGYLGSRGSSLVSSFPSYTGTIYGYIDPYGYSNSYSENYNYVTVIPSGGSTVTPTTPPDRPRHDHPAYPTRPELGDQPTRTGERPPMTPTTPVVYHYPRPSTPPSGDNHPSRWGRGDSGSSSTPSYSRSEPTYSSSSTSSSSAGSSSSSSSYTPSSSSSDSGSSSSYSAPSSSSSSDSSSSSGGGGSVGGREGSNVLQN